MTEAEFDRVVVNPKQMVTPYVATGAWTTGPR
jgi:hypothetical protein